MGSQDIDHPIADTMARFPEINGQSTKCNPTHLYDRIVATSSANSITMTQKDTVEMVPSSNKVPLTWAGVHFEI